MTIRQGSAAPLSPQQGMAASRGRKVSMHRYINGADGARPKHGALTCCKYGLVAPEEPAGNPAAAELQEHGYRHEATMGQGTGM